MDTPSRTGETYAMVSTGCRLRRGAAALLSALLFAGCGPVTATTTISDAVVAIEAARSASAEQYAVYELTRAEYTLRKAREEEGFSDYQAAVDFARASREFAERARARATTRAQEGMMVPGSVAPPPAARMPAGSADAPTDEDLPMGSGL